MGGGPLPVRLRRAYAEDRRAAGGGSRRWLIHRWRINPLLRELRRSTDPLLRHAGIDLDGEGNRLNDLRSRPVP